MFTHTHQKHRYVCEKCTSPFKSQHHLAAHQCNQCLRLKRRRIKRPPYVSASSPSPAPSPTVHDPTTGELTTSTRIHSPKHVTVSVHRSSDSTSLPSHSTSPVPTFQQVPAQSAPVPAVVRSVLPLLEHVPVTSITVPPISVPARSVPMRSVSVPILSVPVQTASSRVNPTSVAVQIASSRKTPTSVAVQTDCGFNRFVAEDPNIQRRSIRIVSSESSVGCGSNFSVFRTSSNSRCRSSSGSSSLDHSSSRGCGSIDNTSAPFYKRCRFQKERREKPQTFRCYRAVSACSRSTSRWTAPDPWLFDMF